MSPEEIFGKRMMQMGAHGFLNKQSSEQEVIRALDLFFRGRKYASQQLMDQLNDEQSKKGEIKNPFLQLSDRETEVLIHLLKGESVKEIANHFNIKSNTVATFKARLFDKIGVSNLIDLQNMARLYNFQIT
jgi:two-component system invasion response regulator UvrY